MSFPYTSLTSFETPYNPRPKVDPKVLTPSPAVRCRPEEVQEFTQFAAQPTAADIIYKKIAPAIFGHDDIKKAIACLLFGGTRKVRSKPQVLGLPPGTSSQNNHKTKCGIHRVYRDFLQPEHSTCGNARPISLHATWRKSAVSAQCPRT